MKNPVCPTTVPPHILFSAEVLSRRPQPGRGKPSGNRFHLPTVPRAGNRLKSLLLTLLALFTLAPASARELRIVVSSSRPSVHQEFEVAYTSDCEIESIAPPRWDMLTLVRELGLSRGTETSILNGEMTRSNVFSYRYIVRSAVAGEVTVPGTTAVIGGRECRFDSRTITIFPAKNSLEPECRLELDTVASAHTGECVVRLVCNRKPDRADPLLAVNGRDTYAPFSSGYSSHNGTEKFEFSYRIPMRDGRKYRLKPQLTFGGKAFDAPVYAVTQGDRTAPKISVRWLLCLVAGIIVCLWGAIYARDHAGGLSRQGLVSRFSWRAYLLVALTVLFAVYIAFIVYWIVSPAGKANAAIIFVAALLLFGLWWLVAGEVRRSAVRLRVDGETLFVTPFLGLGRTRCYDLREFGGVTTSVLTTRSGSFEYGYLMKADRREVRISSFYLKNYRALFDAVTTVCPFRGSRPMNFWLELKELFR